MPKVLYEHWRPGSFPDFKWVSWTILLGRGESLHRAAGKFGWNISKRFIHDFATAPDGASLLEACQWSELARLGGTAEDLFRISENPAYALDPTDRATPEKFRTFWIETAAWIIRHRARLDDDRAAMILEWAMHLYTEDEYRRGRGFTLAGRGFATREAAEEYRRRFRYHDVGRNLVWAKHGWDWEGRTAAGDLWTVRELTSSQELAGESSAMRHCVRGYDTRCFAGMSSIFSVLAGGARCVTVELDPRTREILQVHGVCNRSATKEELAIVARWLLETSGGRNSSL